MYRFNLENAFSLTHSNKIQNSAPSSVVPFVLFSRSNKQSMLWFIENSLLYGHLIELSHGRVNLFFSLVADTREKNEAFGSSLLLANSPMSPKIVNGSFAAIFDADEFLAKTYAGIRIAVIKYTYFSL